MSEFERRRARAGEALAVSAGFVLVSVHPAASEVAERGSVVVLTAAGFAADAVTRDQRDEVLACAIEYADELRAAEGGAG